MDQRQTVMSLPARPCQTLWLLGHRNTIITAIITKLIIVVVIIYCCCLVDHVIPVSRDRALPVAADRVLEQSAWLSTTPRRPSQYQSRSQDLHAQWLSSFWTPNAHISFCFVTSCRRKNVSCQIRVRRARDGTGSGFLTRDPTRPGR